MDRDDDTPIGRILTRREVLALFASAGTLFVIGCGGDDKASSVSTGGAAPTAAPSPGASRSAPAVPTSPASSAAVSIADCIVRPELTEGPYFVDEKLNRADIRSDPSDGSVRPGTLLN